MYIAGRWVSLDVANTIFILWAVAVAVLGVVVWWLSRRSPPKNPAKGKVARHSHSKRLKR